MKFPLSWLKRYLETTATAEDLAAAMTRLGLEVEGVENPADALKPFVIAKVLTAERHPQADKLQVLSVDTGAGAGLQVVCGAPNARAGLVGVFGPPGAHVPGLDVVLKVAAIRGVESNGMMCSNRELLLGDDHDGIIELPADAPVGAAFAAWAGLDDPVFEVALQLEEMALNDPYFVEKKLFPNVDFYSGVILSAIGFPTEMFTVLFALARTVGWVAQWNEMISDPAQKIGRPRQLYTGPTQRDYVAVDKR